MARFATTGTALAEGSMWLHLSAAVGTAMIRDTSAQDRLVEVKSNRKRRFALIGVGIAVVAGLAIAMPGAMRLFSADASVSAAPKPTIDW